MPTVLQTLAKVPLESGDPWFMFTYVSAVVVAVVFWLVGTWGGNQIPQAGLGLAANVYIVVGFMVVVFVLGVCAWSGV